MTRHFSRSRVLTARVLAGTLLAGLGIGLMPSGAAAAPASVDRIDQVWAVYDTCSGEHIQMQGTDQTVWRPNADGTFTSTSIIRLRAIESGTSYVLTAVRRADWDASRGFELAGVMHQVLVSQGGAANVLVWFRWDITVTPRYWSLTEDCTGAER